MHSFQVHSGPSCLQAEGDGVAAKLLATRRETMRLRSKIRELKQQHADLQEIKEAHQQQLQASIDCPASASTVGQCVLCQLPGTQSNHGPADRPADTPSAEFIAAESACKSMSGLRTSDTSCGHTEHMSSSDS